MTTLSNLSEADLIKILTEPKNALVKQYKKIFGMDNVELLFKKDALKSIAELSVKRGTGARGLRSIMEEAMLEVMFEIPSRQDIKRCVITREVVESKIKPLLLTDLENTDLLKDLEKLA